jgi:hypothetical protein
VLSGEITFGISAPAGNPRRLKKPLPAEIADQRLKLLLLLPPDTDSRLTVPPAPPAPR